MSVVPYRSFSERTARERAHALLDDRNSRELLDPFARVSSPHLAAHGIVAQSDDGVVVVRGTIGGRPAVAIATDGRFLGGSIGEAGGAKIAGALECALDDARAGTAIAVAIAFDSGGIRVQEANLAILALAEIHDALVALREHVTVVGIVGGNVGVYGGMSIAAALCGRLIMTRGARLGLNGPEVIETEAGLSEIDTADRALIWRTTGGARRVEQGLADVLVADDVDAIARELRVQLERAPRIVPCRAPA